MITSSIFLLWPLLLQINGGQSLEKEKKLDEKKYVLQALIIDIPPKIDGILDEDVWKNAQAATEFIQKQPNEGKPATENTEVKILVDKKNLYIGVMCYDSEPEKIISNEKRRDSPNIDENDHVQIMLDTFHDKRSGYIFETNPLGAMLDLQVRKEGKNEGILAEKNPNINTDWNGVWQVKSAIHKKGWSTEMKIPLSTLRFKGNSKEGWRANFLRNVRRKNEISTWVPIPRNQFFHKISLAGELRGLEEIKKGLNIQVKPYVLMSRVSQSTENDQLSIENKIHGGADIKYGLASNLTLELTGNTDFSQVEADDQQINLTRFSLYFPEKRDFFLENSALFNIGHPDDAMIFFSRSIGISPQGEEIPLLGGAKIAGKVNSFDIGFINLQSRAKGETPANNFTVLRLSRDVLGKSAIGFMLTNRQSKISKDYNRVFCFDGDFAFGENLFMNAYFAFSSSPALKGTDKSAKLGFRWISDLWELMGSYTDIQKNFNAEMGFALRTGIRRSLAYIGYTPQPKIPGVRRLNPHIRFDYTTDQDNNLLLRKTHLDMAADLINGGRIGLQWNDEREFVDTPFLIHENIIVSVGNYSSPWWEANFNSNKSRHLWTVTKYRWGGFYGGRGHILNMTTGIRPFASLGSEFSFIYNDIHLRQGSFANHLLRARFTYNFSTRLALMSLIQWNSETNEVNINMRLNFIHTPGSDLFIVYNERRLVEGLETGVKDRTLALKFTYLFDF